MLEGNSNVRWYSLTCYRSPPDINACAIGCHDDCDGIRLEEHLEACRQLGRQVRQKLHAEFWRVFKGETTK